MSIILPFLSSILAAGVIAAITSFCVSIFIVYSQAWHGKYSLDNDFAGVQKIHTIAVPRIGGIAMVIGIVVAMCMLFFADPIFKKAVHLEYISKLLLAGFPIFLAGTIEDLTKSVSVKIRLGASILSALLAIWLLGAAIGKLDIWGLDTLLAIESVAVVVTAFVVAGGVNAINIIDGFHGIAASAAIIMLAAMGCIAWQHGDIFVTQLTVLGAGTALGFWISEVAVLLLVRNPVVSAWQLLAICALPIIEVIYSIYRRRIIRKTSPGHADGLHLHTLIYRRFICQSISHDHRKPWRRNASVAFVVAGWIVVMSCAAILFGQTVHGAMAIVAVQVLLYHVLYARLVQMRRLKSYWREISGLIVSRIQWIAKGESS